MEVMLFGSPILPIAWILTVFLKSDRDPNKEEEPIKNPAKLFRVERIKPLKGAPHFEKKIMVYFGIADEQANTRKINPSPVSALTNICSIVILGSWSPCHCRQEHPGGQQKIVDGEAFGSH